MSQSEVQYELQLLRYEEGDDHPVLEVFVKPRSLLSLGRPVTYP
jgi:hypothetical protein